MSLPHNVAFKTVQMISIVLDANIYDVLAVDAERCFYLRELIQKGRVEVLVSPVVHDQLRAGPFKDVSCLFPIRLISEAVAVVGVAKVGLARPGNGNVYKEHRGASNQYEDAIIADTAHCDADIFVSKDKRCRQRLQTISSTLKCFDYDEFAAWIENQRL